MSMPLQPIYDKHEGFLTHLRRLVVVADVVGYVPADEVQAPLNDVSRFLTRYLIPHLRAEGEVLYPVVNQLSGSSLATEAMRRDCEEVLEFSEELDTLRRHLTLGSLTFRDANALRRVLYGLKALLDLHIAKQEDIYLPLLDERLTGEEVLDLLRRMEHVSESMTHSEALRDEADQCLAAIALD